MKKTPKKQGRNFIRRITPDAKDGSFRVRIGAAGVVRNYEIIPLGDHTYRMVSDQKSAIVQGIYDIDLKAGICDCGDFAYRRRAAKSACKHLKALAALAVREKWETS